MGLFKRKKTIEGGSSKELDRPQLNYGTKMNKGTINEIVKTTDSMRIMAAGSDSWEKEKVEEASKALMRSYDIATKKIIDTYEEITETKKVINIDFLTVQLLIGQYDKTSDIDHIRSVIKVFSEEFQAQLAHGRSVKLTNKILIEPTDYIGKTIPTAKLVEEDHKGVNTVSWLDIANVLKTGNIINISDIETIEYLINAMESNILNGYYLQFGNLVIAKINAKNDELMVLFSRDTINKFNNIYSKDRYSKRRKTIVKTNYVDEYKESVSTKEEDENNVKKALAETEASAKVKEDKINKEIKENEEKHIEQLNRIDEIKENKIEAAAKIQKLNEEAEKEAIERAKEEIKNDESRTVSPLEKFREDQKRKDELNRKIDEVLMWTDTPTKKTVTKKTTVKKTTTKKAAAKKKTAAKKKPAAKKPAAKKAVAKKKPAAKKPAAKKAAPKKTATKKPAAKKKPATKKVAKKKAPAKKKTVSNKPLKIEEGSEKQVKRQLLKKHELRTQLLKMRQQKK